MSNIPKIKNDVQNRSSEAWRKLCEYVEHVAQEGLEEFSPLEYLGHEVIYTNTYIARND